LKESTVARRYARAFFEIADEEKRWEEYYAELDAVCRLIEDNEELKGFLANPIVEQKDKKSLVETLLASLNLSPITANFIRLLTDKKRIIILRDIVDAYREMMDDALNIMRVKVRTAFPLPLELQEQLKAALIEKSGRKVNMEIQEDRDLLGGLVVQMGDLVFDNSVKTQLNKIRNQLGEER